MSRPKSSPDPAGRAEQRISPLTQSMTDGKPYQRRADVEEEIVRALADGPVAWPDMAARSSGSAGGLSSEAIVFLIRSIRPPGQEAVLSRLVEALSRRITRIVTAAAQGFDLTTTQEIVDTVNADVFDLIFAESACRQSEFLEIAFKMAVKKRALNQVEKRGHHPRASQFAVPIIDPNRPESGVIDPIDMLIDPGPGPEQLAIDSESSASVKDRVRAGLAAISDPRHRNAVILHYLEDWPIAGGGTPSRTLTAHFGISGRQIQNWMNTAFAEMRDFIGYTYEQ